MSRIPIFEVQFKKYKLEWMTRTSGQYSEMMVREFYMAYQMDLKR